MNLRKAAKGRECMVRLVGICCGDPQTTVLAHIRLPGLSGMGLKANDFLGAWACFTCHSAIDRRSNMDLDRDYVRLAHLEGMARTQAALLEELNIMDEFMTGVRA
jgi:hypothetical protein